MFVINIILELQLWFICVAQPIMFFCYGILRYVSFIYCVEICVVWCFVFC